jgi:hypothetical protein
MALSFENVLKKFLKSFVNDHSDFVNNQAAFFKERRLRERERERESEKVNK